MTSPPDSLILFSCLEPSRLLLESRLLTAESETDVSMLPSALLGGLPMHGRWLVASELATVPKALFAKELSDLMRGNRGA